VAAEVRARLRVAVFDHCSSTPGLTLEGLKAHFQAAGPDEVCSAVEDLLHNGFLTRPPPYFPSDTQHQARPVALLSAPDMPPFHEGFFAACGQDHRIYECE